MTAKITFSKDLSAPDPIPQAGIERAVKLMKNGRLHRYGEAKGDELDVLELEKEYAAYMGLDYCVGINSCGCALFIALKAVGVQPGDKVLVNAFTLAPVPGAVAHCNAEPVLVEVTDDYVIDLEDLRRKAEMSEAKVLLLSHMRGHIVDMEALTAVCRDLGLILVEDCAHTMGASWNGQLTGTFGAVGCFSTQTFKHINSGEGGLLVTNDADIAAQAILFSGSYMLYRQHGARPSDEVFDRWKGTTPNFSMRLSNFAAAVARPQIGLLAERAVAWNGRYAQLAERLAEIPHVTLPHRPEKEGYVASSIQFTVSDLTVAEMQTFQNACIERGVLLKWFGGRQAVGFTSSHRNWEYLGEGQSLPNSDAVMYGLFDMRIPLSLTEGETAVIASIIHESLLATR
ncbi:MAG: aminotransferase class I/II-fold pyridoxal phosphate-dependent enzyme [Chloroflexota bacterium]